MRQEIADFLDHFAWALVGQECDCGSDLFNPLARWLDKRVNAPDQWDDDLNYIGWWSWTLCHLADPIHAVARWLDRDLPFDPSTPESDNIRVDREINEQIERDKQ